MNRFRLLAAFAAALLLSACAVEGTPVPIGSGYRSSLGPDIKMSLALQFERDRARGLDPCGMLDESALIAEVGVPRHFGADFEPDQCTARFDREVTINGVNSVEVKLSVSVDSTGQQIRIGDRDAHVRDSGNLCHITVPYNDTRAFFYSIGGERGADLCGQLQRIVTASEPLLDGPPSRAESTRMPDTKAWKLDPCAALTSAYAPDQPIKLSGLNPFECDFRLGFEHNPSDTNRFGITFLHMDRNMAGYAQEHERRLRIVGVDAVEETGDKDYCMIEINVGADSPFPVVNHDGETEQWIEIIKVAGYGCTETRRVAVAAVKEYQKG